MGYAIKKESWKAKRWVHKATSAASEPLVIRASGTVLRAAFAATLFLSAALLFVIEPMVAKMLLPFLGGAPAVWTTCMVFFQTVLLGGYLYAHASSTRLSLHNQTMIHFALIVLSAIFVPIGITGAWGGLAVTNPVLAVTLVLSLSIGLPFLTLSASAPLLQHWYSRTGDAGAKNPYFLYSASNVGSLLALVCYPTILEPGLGVSSQSFGWGVGFCALACLVAFCIYLVRAANIAQNGEASLHVVERHEAAVDADAPKVMTKARWVLLAFIPSSLMLGVTTYFTTDIATIPLLWTVPLAIYLLSFILVFSKMPAVAHKVFRFVMPFAAITLLYFSLSRAWMPIAAQLTWHLVTFFLVTMVCHGELARTRPEAKHLTAFYLWMSFGGMVGGLFNALVAPHAFSTAMEYPLVLAIACGAVSIGGVMPFARYQRANRIADVAIALVVGFGSYWLISRWIFAKVSLGWLSALFHVDMYAYLPLLTYGTPAAICAAIAWFRRPARLGLAVTAYTIAALLCNRFDQSIVALDRSFFGILKVSDDYYGDYRTLVNGTTLHGRQHRDPAKAHTPLTYYHRQGPVGQLFEEFSGNNQKENLAFIGLGTGTLASYGEPGQKLTFFEIDEAVVRIAKTYFTFLKDCRAEYRMVMGDARLKLQEEPDGKFGMILVDAFSSDAIPVHLLTKEAIELYFRKLAPGGVVAIHTSNRYLTLEPVLGKLAKEAGLVALVNHDNGDNAAGKFASTWNALARKDGDFGNLKSRGNWVPLDGYSWTPVWTDDFTSLFEVLR